MEQDLPPDVSDVLEFWFGSVDPCGAVPPACSGRWFQGSPELDAEIASRFGAILDDLERVQGWAETLPGALAAIAVLDQFPRNAFRGTPRAFATDEKALAVSTRAVEAGWDRQAGLLQRVALYLPFEHAESLEAQDRSVALFRVLAEETSGEAAGAVEMFAHFAADHREIVARFGRFPGRNRALGREDTPEETAWIAAGGATFGQR